MNRHQRVYLIILFCQIRNNQGKADENDVIGKGNQKPGSTAQHPSASPLDPPGAVFEPPANQRGAAPHRRIVNRQVVVT